MNIFLKQLLVRFYIIFAELGIDFYRIFLLPKSIKIYIRNYIFFKKQYNKYSNEKISFELLPRLNDRNQLSGSYDNEYFLTDLFISQYIYANNLNINNLLDVGSRVDGFVSNVASFRKINIIDIRNVPKELKNIKGKRLDMTGDYKSIPRERYDFITSIHAIEHFGLGRYGDPIDFNGHIKAIRNINKLLKINGTFFLGVPYSKENKIIFDCHRKLTINTWEKALIENGFLIQSKYHQYRNNWPEVYKKNLEKENGLIIFRCTKTSRKDRSKLKSKNA